MRIFILMKTRLNITIDDIILMKIKAHAADNQTSVSQIIEEHLKTIVKTSDRKHSIDDIEDALQYYTALHFKLNIFISRDKKLKAAAFRQLPVYNISEFLELL